MSLFFKQCPTSYMLHVGQQHMFPFHIVYRGDAQGSVSAKGTYVLLCSCIFAVQGSLNVFESL